MKKVLGIILAVSFAIVFCGGLFLIVFLAAYNTGITLWLCLLLGFIPFIGTAVIVGILVLIIYLLKD